MAVMVMFTVFSQLVGQCFCQSIHHGCVWDIEAILQILVLNFLSVDLLVWETLAKDLLVRRSLCEDILVLNLLSVHPLVRNALSEDALEEEEEKQA